MGGAGAPPIIGPVFWAIVGMWVCFTIVPTQG